MSQKEIPGKTLASSNVTPARTIRDYAPRGGGPAVPAPDATQDLTRRATIRRAFLDVLAQTGNHTTAAQAAGIDRVTAYRWRDEDPEFAEAYEEAEQTATEVLEGEAWRRAVHGTEYVRRSYWKGEVCGEDVKREYSDNLMTILLRARAPHKYRETTNVDVRQVVKVVAGIDPSEVLGTYLGTTPQLLSSNSISGE